MRFIATAIAVSLIFIACNSNEAEITRLKIENSSLKKEKITNDSIMLSLSKTHNEIDSNLQLIEKKKADISALAKKRKLSKEEKEFILAEMDSINQLLLSNRDKVEDLDSSLKGEQRSHLGLSQLIASMDDKNLNSNHKLEEMKSDLATVSADFSELFEDYVYKEVENLQMKEQLSSQIQELEAAQKKLDEAKKQLNSAYYIVGTTSELKGKGLILKKGFFDENNMSQDFDKTQFKKIDIHELKEIILDSKSANLITTHPTESYELVGIKKKVNRLVIKNPELFWSASKFLIVEIE